ncbi:MAG: hypothetical protein ABSA75_13530 [Candidatus Bathyarchaeia archaeon]|jgi:hypothetical protein
MSLNFTLDWTYDLLPDQPYFGEYAYTIDNNTLVSITSNQTASDLYGHTFDNPKFFKYNPSFSYLIDVSNLTNGHHEIAIFGLFYFGISLLYNQSSPHVEFLVQNPTPSPTPYLAIGALFSPLNITRP